MAGIKIVDLPALGRDLAATDLLELSLAGGTGSRKITGQEIMNASKLSVGNTPIINGTSGRLLFQGTGDVLQQSEDFAFDAVNSRVLLGKASNNTAQLLFQYPRISSLNGVLWADNLNNPYGYLALDRGSGEMRMFTGGSYFPTFYSSGSEAMRIATTRNVLIGTTTDAGFKLDVNGTARIVNALTLGNVVLSLSSQGNGTISSANSVGNPTTYITLSGPVYYNPTSGTAGTFAVAGQSFMSSGTAQFNTLTVAPIINNSGTYSGIFRGFYYNPTLTSLTGTTHRAIETTTGDVLFGNGSLTISSSGPTFNMNVLNNSQISAIYMNATDGNPRGGLYTNISTGEVRLIAGTGGYFQTFYSNNAERVRITTSGNVLMGTTTDAGYRLDVNGNIRGGLVYSTSNMFMDGNTGKLRSNWGTLQLEGASSVQINNSVLVTGNQNFNFINSSFTPNNSTNSNLILSGNSSVAGFTNGGAGGSSIGNVCLSNINIQTAIGNVTLNHFVVQNNINNTAGTSLIRGFYYNPTLTSMTNTTHFAIHTTAGRVRFEGLPTSPTGLNAGDLWNDAGTLKIV